MVLIILGILGVIGGIILICKDNKSERKNGYGDLLMLAAVSIPLCYGLSTYYSHLEKKAYLESFYFSNSSSYAMAVDKTSAYLSQESFEGKLLTGSIEKQQLTTSISDRIAEWRNGVVAYNQFLKTYQLYKGNFITGIFIPKLDSEVKSLVIQ